MDNKYYVLDGHNPKEVDDILGWAASFEDTKSRVVDQTKIGESEISTVFLGLNHRYGEGEPLLFETMIFGGKEDGFQERYSTWDEAVKGHEIACNMVKNEHRKPWGWII